MENDSPFYPLPEKMTLHFIPSLKSSISNGKKRLIFCIFVNITLVYHHMQVYYLSNCITLFPTLCMGMHTKAAIIEVASTGPWQTFSSCSRNWYNRDMVSSHAEHGYVKKMQKHSFCTPLKNHPQNSYDQDFFC